MARTCWLRREALSTRSSLSAGTTGVFSFAITEGLGQKRADENDDGMVMLSELRAHVAKRAKGY